MVSLKCDRRAATSSCEGSWLTGGSQFRRQITKRSPAALSKLSSRKARYQRMSSSPDPVSGVNFAGSSLQSRQTPALWGAASPPRDSRSGGIESGFHRSLTSWHPAVPRRKSSMITRELLKRTSSPALPTERRWRGSAMWESRLKRAREGRTGGCICWPRVIRHQGTARLQPPIKNLRNAAKHEASGFLLLTQR